MHNTIPSKRSMQKTVKLSNTVQATTNRFGRVHGMQHVCLFDGVSLAAKQHCAGERQNSQQCMTCGIILALLEGVSWAGFVASGVLAGSNTSLTESVKLFHASATPIIIDLVSSSVCAQTCWLAI